jgi:glycosyltransferase involved in cell wall biosynthesis
MLEDMPDYSVIIPAFNEEEFLAETILAAREAMNAGDRKGELIVVDNNSTDSTAEVARKAGADRVVFEAHNQIARARNAGAAATTTPLLVFVDADTRIN